ncbi:MAG: hypothetical protein HQ541_11000 [Mariniphaga sp.]|nr:hypothetical protein [Mariniphaga sp.]
MKNHFQEGIELRNKIKELIFDFIKQNPECKARESGLKQTVIFRECGMDWGNKKKVTSGRQQFWVNAILRELEDEGVIMQDAETNKWRLSN